MTTISSIQFAKHDFPLLASLSLDEDEWSAIRNNGYIIEDMRSARSYFKLRFRRHKQEMKYLGTDLVFVEGIRNELLLLQAERNAIRQLRKRNVAARTLLKHVKETLAGALEKQGYNFHGFSVRKSRSVSHFGVRAKRSHHQGVTNE